MKRYVSDTQCVIWYFADDEHRMPKAARSAFAAADQGRAQILVPSIVLVESVFLAQRQRVHESVLKRLLALSDVPDSNIYVVPLDLAVARTVGDFGPSAVPELADRIIARPRSAAADHRPGYRSKRPGESGEVGNGCENG